MQTISKFASVSILAIALAACSDSSDAPEADNVTETQMDDVEVIDGTISDEMVDVDTEQDGDAMAEGEEGNESDGDSESNADASEE